MSYFEQQIRRGLKARPPVASFVLRLRQNFALKGIALIASILLYVYVQAERHPFAPRAFSAAIMVQDAPPDAETALDKPTVPVSILGPPEIMDRLTDSDIHVVVNLKDASRDTTKFQVVHGHFFVDGLDKPTTDKLVFEPAEPIIRYQVFTSTTRKFPVHALYPKDAPPNFEYGNPVLDPWRVEVSGRSDKMSNVTHVVADATHTDTDGPIDREFPVVARDKDENPVEGVSVKPAMARLRVPLTPKIATKIVMVSVLSSSLPVPPYFISSLTATPAQVQIIGRPEAIAAVSTVPTELLPFADVTQSQDMTAHLIKSVTYEIRDLEGHPIDLVRAQVEIQKQTPPKTPTPDTPKPPVDGAKPKTEPKPNGNP